MTGLAWPPGLDRALASIAAVIAPMTAPRPSSGALADQGTHRHRPRRRRRCAPASSRDRRPAARRHARGASGSSCSSFTAAGHAGGAGGDFTLVYVFAPPAATGPPSPCWPRVPAEDPRVPSLATRSFAASRFEREIARPLRHRARRPSRPAPARAPPVLAGRLSPAPPRRAAARRFRTTRGSRSPSPRRGGGHLRDHGRAGARRASSSPATSGSASRARRS